MKMPIYLDNHASTPIDPRVLDAMWPYLTERYGNAASGHAWGREAKEGIEAARGQVARMVSAEPEEVIFTGGATEANNAVLGGVTEALEGRKNHIIISPIEHSSVLNAAQHLAERGWRLTILPIGPSGIIVPDDVKRAITPQTAIVSVMSANNEIGTIQPVREISRLCKERGVVFHTDACQGFGRVELDACPIGEPCAALADMISLSAHKVYGPKGVGALIVRKGTPFKPQMLGGTHENGMRAGTPNTAGIVGLGVACEVMAEDWPEESGRLGEMRDRLLARLQSDLGTIVHVNGVMGDGTVRLPHNLNMTLLAVCQHKLEKALDGVLAVSSGSACLSNSPQTSRIIKAIKAPGVKWGAIVRIGLGRFTTEEEVERAADILTSVARTLYQSGCDGQQKE